MPVLANAKHEAVAQLAAKGIDGTHAYMSVYPDCSEEAARRNASRLLTNADVKSRVRELQSKVAARVVEKTAIDAAWVLERSVELVERCMQAVPVLTAKGEPTGDYQFDSSGANRALDRIGKHTGGFAESATAPPSQTLILNGLSEAQLDAAIAKLAGGRA